MDDERTMAYELLEGLRCQCGGSSFKVYVYQQGRSIDDAARLAACICRSCGWLVTPHWLDGFWVGRWEEAGRPGTLPEFIEAKARAILASGDNLVPTAYAPPVIMHILCQT